MDISSNQLTSTASPSSSSPHWDVFLSFHGKDTRHSFTSHLYFALHKSGIQTFRDDPELERGQEISSGLFKAIQDSKVSIVVLSNNYATSSWCLDELVEILACKKTKGLVVHPVFYHVDPSTVRYQKDSFGEALVSHQKHYSVDKIDKWRTALTEISNLSGYHIQKYANENETETIQKILKDVASLVPTNAIHLEEHLVGIDCVVEEIYEKLSMQSNDVRAIGICGMGGIGKSTIAKAFYNKYRGKFNSSCFVENVKRTLQSSHNLLSLINQLLAQLLKMKDYSAFDVESGIRKLNEIISSTKVLIVLDDFDESSDLELIVQRCNLFSPESRIIMTTRDTNLPSRLGIDISMVKELGENESLELFSYHAFKTTVPLEDFRNISKGFVEYVEGLPLALKVLGSSLRGRDVSFWKEKLEKVRKIPENKIHEILKLSYDELSDRTLKDIFLDIVFFFVGKDKDEAVSVFESCNFFPHNGIPILLEKCLLRVENNKLKMHSLIQNMGWEVIHQESHDPGKTKRLVCQENAFEMFKYQEGKDKIEALILDLTSWTRRNLNTNIFEMMPKLRLLEIANAPHDFKISLKNSFQELRYFRWHYCPWTCLPSSFRPKKLVILDMPFSNFKTLWKGSLPLVNLKSINVSCSMHLKILPNFDNVKRLEMLSLGGCRNLVEFHPSFLQLSKLSHLELRKCQNLKRLPKGIGQLDGLRKLDFSGCNNLKLLPHSINQLTGLSELRLRECYNLTKLPELVGNMKGLEVLDASYTSIEQLPDSICQLRHLYDLNLSCCEKLSYLPDQIGDMKGLRMFDASYTAIRQLPDSFKDLISLSNLILMHCRHLERLPDQLGDMKGLRMFDASYTAIRQLPDSFKDLISLSNLILMHCRHLERLPDQLGEMKCLEFLYASYTAIEGLPDSIAQLSRLQVLDIMRCEKVEEICGGICYLTSLEFLNLGNRNSLKILPDSMKNMKGLQVLTVTCNIRSCLPRILCMTSLTVLDLTDVGDCFFSTKPFSLSNLPDLRYLRLVKCTSLGSSLPELPLTLETLVLERYELLEELPDLSTLISLTTLRIRGCNSLQSLSLLPPHLREFEIYDCRSMRGTVDHLTTNLKDLEYLRMIECGNLIFKAGESFFQVLESDEFWAVTTKTEIPNWFGNRRKSGGGRRVDCVVPEMISPNIYVYMLFWFVYSRTLHDQRFEIMSVVTNKTNDTRHEYFLEQTRCGVGGLAIARIRLDETFSPGDRLTVSFKVVVIERGCIDIRYLKVSDKRIRLENCGIQFL